MLSAFLLALIAAEGAVAAQVPLQPPPLTPLHLAHLTSPEYTSFLEDIRKNASIPGLSVGVVRLGEDNEPVVQLASSGRKTEDGNGQDLTVDTLFGLASCSKAFLATSVGILIDDFAQGKNTTSLPSHISRFDWDTKVVDILPTELGWAMQEPDGSGVGGWTTQKASIKDILGHVSGLPRHDYAYAFGDTAEDVVKRMQGLRTAYELREKWSYNNQMYVLGSYIVAHYSGMSYADFVEKRIFKRVGMQDTTVWPSIANSSGKLSDAWTKAGRRIPFWFDDTAVALNTGAGGVISSAEDMVKWLAVWLNKGVEPLTNKTIFPESVYNAVTTANWIASGPGYSSAYGSSIVGYSMGWERWSYGNVDVLEHGGAIPGFSILTAFSPRHNIGVSVLCNADEKAMPARAVLKRTLDIVLGLPLSPLDLGISKPRELPAPPASAPPPSLKLAHYEGVYTSPGYRPMALCHAGSKSTYCKDVLANITSLGAPSGFTRGLYGAFDSIWATHVRLAHFAGDTFNITFTAIMPHGFGRNSTPFELYETGTSGGWVEFDVAPGGGEVTGFSLVVDPPAVEARARKTGGGIKMAADAWFERA